MFDSTNNLTFILTETTAAVQVLEWLAHFCLMVQVLPNTNEMFTLSFFTSLMNVCNCSVYLI